MAENTGSGPAGALIEAEKEIFRLLDLFPAAVLICSKDRVSQANAKAAALFHLRDGERLEGRPLAGLVQRVGTARAACVLHRPDGTRGMADLAESADGNETIIVLLEHEKERRETYSSRLATAIFTATDEAMLITDADQIILSVNPAFERATGYSAAEAIGHTPRLLSSGRHDADFYSELWETLLENGHWHGEIWNRRKNGELYLQRITISVLHDDDGTIVNYVAVFSDITVSKREVDRLHDLANHDSLTHLPNRVLLRDRIDQALAHASRNGSRAALLFLDLDGFKLVNDKMGHLIGDRVLETVAERLSGCVRESDTVARLGGDEFVVLLPDIGAAADADKLADKLLAALAAPFVFEEGKANIGGSIGIALYPRHGDSAETLLAAADEAMYRAKREGGRRAVRAEG